jgi:hypothetical protein
MKLRTSPQRRARLSFSAPGALEIPRRGQRARYHTLKFVSVGRPRSASRGHRSPRTPTSTRWATIISTCCARATSPSTFAGTLTVDN